MSTELTTSNAKAEIVADLTAANAQYFSGNTDTKADKAALVNAIQNPDEQLRDHINEKIELVNIYIAPVECESQEVPGETVTCPRVILFAADGTTYSCVSKGVYNALKTIVQTFGEPSEWDEPLTVLCKQINKGDRALLTLKIAN